MPVKNAPTGNQKVFEEDDFRPNSIIEEFKDIRGWKILELGMLEAGLFKKPLQPVPQLLNNRTFRHPFEGQQWPCRQQLTVQGNL